MQCCFTGILTLYHVLLTVCMWRCMFVSTDTPWLWLREVAETCSRACYSKLMQFIGGKLVYVNRFFYLYVTCKCMWCIRMHSFLQIARGYSQAVLLLFRLGQGHVFKSSWRFLLPFRNMQRISRSPLFCFVVLMRLTYAEYLQSAHRYVCVCRETFFLYAFWRQGLVVPK